MFAWEVRIQGRETSEARAAAECYGLDALETVKTSTVETDRKDELPEDLWPISVPW